MPTLTTVARVPSEAAQSCAHRRGAACTPGDDATSSAASSKGILRHLVQTEDGRRMDGGWLIQSPSEASDALHGWTYWSHDQPPSLLVVAPDSCLRCEQPLTHTQNPTLPVVPRQTAHPLIGPTNCPNNERAGCLSMCMVRSCPKLSEGLRHLNVGSEAHPKLIRRLRMLRMLRMGTPSFGWSIRRTPFGSDADPDSGWL